MVQLIVLFGSSGSGKSFWKQWLVKNGCVNVESWTTRHRRSSEDREYHFVSKKAFESLFTADRLFNVNKYHGEWYGCSLEDFDWDIRAAKACESREDGCLSSPFVMISDITSLTELKKDIETRYPRQLQIFFVECKPPVNYEQLLTMRGTPERISIAREEVEKRKTVELGVPLFTTIRNEEDTVELLRMVN